MPRLTYIVIATLPTAQMAEQYAAWLKDGHVQAVIEGGAATGEVVRLDSAAGGPARVMSHYTFASRERFDRYVKETAPRLRAEGLAQFGPDRGVAYERLVGEIQ